MPVGSAAPMANSPPGIQAMPGGAAPAGAGVGGIAGALAGAAAGGVDAVPHADSMSHALASIPPAIERQAWCGFHTSFVEVMTRLRDPCHGVELTPVCNATLQCRVATRSPPCASLFVPRC
jgi:hypothetical protein